MLGKESEIWYPGNNLLHLSQGNETLSNLQKIVNIFNDYFSTIAEKTKAKIGFLNKSFDNFLQRPNKNSFFLRPTSSDEITNLILSLNESKSVGPNGLPTKILKLLKNDISLQLTNIFNLSFSTGVFPSGLKIAKVIPIHKKESKLKCSNYRPISLLSNLDKILEKLMHNRIYEFLEKYKLIYPLQFGFRQHYSISYAQCNWINNRSSWWRQFYLWHICGSWKGFWYCWSQHIVKKN